MAKTPHSGSGSLPVKFVPVPESFDLFRLVSQLGSSAAMLLGIGYLSGFMVYHTYLGNAGVVPLGLLSVQYLVAGILFVGAVSLVWVPAWIGEMMARSAQAVLRNKGESQAEIARKSFPARVVGGASGWLLGGAVLYAIGVKFFYLFWWIPLTYGPHLILRRSYGRAAGLEGTRLSPNARFAIFVFPLLALVLVVLSGAFGATIYPQIDRAVGGGRPVRLELELTTVREPVSGVFDVLAATDAQWVFRDTTATSYYIVSSDQVKVATLRGDAISDFGRRFRPRRN